MASVAHRGAGADQIRGRAGPESAAAIVIIVSRVISLARRLDRRRHVGDHLPDQGLVVALGHDADQLFGARGADQKAALAGEAGFGVGDGGFDRSAFQRLSGDPGN